MFEFMYQGEYSRLDLAMLQIVAVSGIDSTPLLQDAERLMLSHRCRMLALSCPLAEGIQDADCLQMLKSRRLSLINSGSAGKRVGAKH